MKTGTVLKIVALACVAVFAVGVLAFGLMTGFGFGDLIAGTAEGMTPYEIPYEYTEEAEYLREIKIDWVSGPVTLSLYDGDVIRITETARRELQENEKLEFDLSGGELSVKWDSALFHFSVMADQSKSLEVWIPEALADSLSKVSVRSVSGDIRTENFAAKDVSFGTTSGGMEIRGIRAETMELSSTSGDITGENLTASEKLRAGNTSGETVLTVLTAGELELNTTSGEILAEGVADALSCRSVSGNVALTMRKWAESAEISTVSGKVEFTAPEAEDGFTCDFSSVSGDLTCGFEAQKSGDTYTYGAGAAKLKISTTSGDVLLNPTK